jgi:adenine-specific DNA-methyltransferase
MQLGAPVFDEAGAIHPEVRFATLAAFVWMQETRTPWHKKKGSSPYLGTFDGVAYYLLFNGILGDRRPQGGNVLTRAVLDWLTMNFPHPGPRVIFGESVRLGPERLAADNVAFRSIPHEVEAR